jgi:hypothetical protein
MACGRKVTLSLHLSPVPFGPDRGQSLGVAGTDTFGRGA